MKKIKKSLVIIMCLVMVLTLVSCSIAFGAGGGTDIMARAILAKYKKTVEYPTKPINMVIAFGAGGGTDIMARAILAKFGPTNVVINMAGGGTSIAADYILNQRSDGYHVMVCPMESMTMACATGSYVDPKSFAKFTPIASVVSDIFSILVSQGSGFKSLEDVIKYAKANPGKLGVVVTGANSFSHIAAIKVFEILGIDVTFSPYTSGADIRTALMGNHEKIAIAPNSDMAAAIKSGGAIPIAMCSEKRSALLPDVPTLKELGFSLDSFGYTIASHRTFWVKGDTSPEIIKYLTDTLKKTMDNPDVIASLKGMYYDIEWIYGKEMVKLTSDMYGYLSEEYAKLTKK